MKAVRIEEFGGPEVLRTSASLRPSRRKTRSSSSCGLRT
jgi:hypothetical protein